MPLEMPWDPVPSTFDRARRRETYRRLARLFRRNPPSGLPSLDEVKDRMPMFEQRYVGIRPIEVAKIVGTAERAPNFDRDFLPKTSETRQRWQRLEKLFRDGSLPPIAVYKVQDSYYVIDGHHRVAIAKAGKQEYIDAEVTELFSRYDIPPDADVGRLILGEQEALFMSESGLERARPNATIHLSRPNGYIELLEVIRSHGYLLSKQAGRVLSDEETAADFYDNIYVPGVEAIKREGLGDALPHATEADLFLWAWQTRRTLFPEHGDMSLEDAAAKAGADRKTKKARKAARKERSGD
jgi:hypothetical protein